MPRNKGRNTSGPEINSLKRILRDKAVPAQPLLEANPWHSSPRLFPAQGAAPEAAAFTGAAEAAALQGWGWPCCRGPSVPTFPPPC